jgi:hypothetical protein
MSCYLFNEASTFFLNARWFMEKAGVAESSALYLGNAGVLWLAFLGCRVCFNGYMLLHMQARLSFYRPVLARVLPTFDFVGLPLLALAHNALNWFWFYLLSRKGAKTLGLIKRSVKRRAK